MKNQPKISTLDSIDGNKVYIVEKYKNDGKQPFVI